MHVKKLDSFSSIRKILVIPKIRGKQKQNINYTAVQLLINSNELLPPAA